MQIACITEHCSAGWMHYSIHDFLGYGESVAEAMDARSGRLMAAFFRERDVHAHAEPAGTESQTCRSKLRAALSGDAPPPPFGEL